MRQIAVYGKGGIGKSTTSANLAASFAEMGLNTWYVGCDPKSDGSMTLLEGRQIRTYLDMLKDPSLAPEEVVVEGFGGVRCVETGGPIAGVGCAGRGIIVAVQALYRDYFTDDIDVVIYDVPGDVVCGGFAAPLREGFADEVYIVTSGEYLALYAANNIARGLENLSVRLGGLICNSREVEREADIVSGFGEMIGSGMVGLIPRSPVVRECENHGRTVIEGAPGSDQAEAYRTLAKAIISNGSMAIPSPVDPTEIRAMLREKGA